MYLHDYCDTTISGVSFRLSRMVLSRMQPIILQNKNENNKSKQTGPEHELLS